MSWDSAAVPSVDRELNRAVDVWSQPLAAAESSELWDAIVVGAGPAGATAALRLGQAGYRVLLIEAKRFPRDKVCGSCLNRRAWSVLVETGLEPEIMRAGAIELDRMQLICGRRSAAWSMPTMRAISRRTLDQLLVTAAMQAGVRFAGETHARIASATAGAESIDVHCRHRAGTEVVVRARVVIAADGLSHSSLSDIEQAASRVARGSRVGLGATLDYDGDGYPIGQLSMIVGAPGYVGVTRVEQGRLNLAAALSVSVLRTATSPGAVIEGLLRGSGMEVPLGCREANWVGTPPLTRESGRWSARRVFLIGDATGYVEPFTGEGMSWALSGAVAVCHFAERAIAHWSDALSDEWHVVWRKNVRQHQATCRGLAWLLRRPRLSEITLRGVRWTPWLAQWVMRRAAGPDVSGKP